MSQNQNQIQLPKEAEINAVNARIKITEHEISYMEYDNKSDSTNNSWFERRYVFDFISVALLEENQDFFKELDKQGITYQMIAEICACELEKDDKLIPAIKSSSDWNDRHHYNALDEAYNSKYQLYVEDRCMSDDKFNELWPKMKPRQHIDKAIDDLEKHVRTSCIEMIRDSESWDELRTRLQELLKDAEDIHDISIDEAYSTAFAEAQKKDKDNNAKRKNSDTN